MTLIILALDSLDVVDDAGRFFIIVYNTTTTVSAAYATFIALAIAAALGAILGLIYWALLSSKSETSSYEEPSSGYGKSIQNCFNDFITWVGNYFLFVAT